MAESLGKKRDTYFQSIARLFIQLRGAPLFLSSKELDLIASWEKIGIPLHIVLEGIREAFGSDWSPSKRKRKVLSLGFCRRQVLKAFEQYRERKVGDQKTVVKRDVKRKRVRKEVQEFLKEIPSEIGYLRDCFARAKNILAHSPVNEKELEIIEAEVEGLLLENSKQIDKNHVRIEASLEFEDQKEKLEEIFRMKLIKFLREKHKIPHISLYYY